MTTVTLSPEELEDLRSRFFLQVDTSSNGCWRWRGAHHSSGAGKYIWRRQDGGDGRYVLAHRVAFFLATGVVPRYLRNLCGVKDCCKSSHYWTKQTDTEQPKPPRAVRGAVARLKPADIRHLRLLATLSDDEVEIGKQYGLTPKQVAQVAMGRVRPEAGGRIRPSRFRGIQEYHRRWEAELYSLRPGLPAPAPITPPLAPGLPFRPVSDRSFPHTSYGQPGRRLHRTGRW